MSRVYYWLGFGKGYRIDEFSEERELTKRSWYAECPKCGKKTLLKVRKPSDKRYMTGYDKCSRCAYRKEIE